MAAHSSTSSRGPKRGGGAGRLAGEAAGVGAVVLMVSVTGTVVALDVKLTVLGVNVHVLSYGRFEQAEVESMAEPVNPAAAWKVSVVDPDWPGARTTMVVGDAVIRNVLLTVTCTAGEVEP